MPYYYKVDGLYIWINTKETCHKGHPYVHAEYHGEKISIDLDGHVMKGNIRNSKAKTIAIRWVVANREFLREEWRRIHHV